MKRLKLRFKRSMNDEINLILAQLDVNVQLWQIPYSKEWRKNKELLEELFKISGYLEAKI